MKIERILQALDEELNRLRQARSLLAGLPPNEMQYGSIRRKRNLSDDARQRIADAQRRRWAAQKASA